MTSFELFFGALKKVLGRNNLYGVWPDFEPQYNQNEYMWTTLRGLGEVLLLNCGTCEGPSDLRHRLCEDCVETRKQTASRAYKQAAGRDKRKWQSILLCRIHSE